MLAFTREQDELKLQRWYDGSTARDAAAQPAALPCANPAALRRGAGMVAAYHPFSAAGGRASHAPRTASMAAPAASPDAHVLGSARRTHSMSDAGPEAAVGALESSALSSGPLRTLPPEVHALVVESKQAVERLQARLKKEIAAHYATKKKLEDLRAWVSSMRKRASAKRLHRRHGAPGVSPHAARVAGGGGGDGKGGGGDEAHAAGDVGLARLRGMPHRTLPDVQEEEEDSDGASTPRGLSASEQLPSMPVRTSARAGGTDSGAHIAATPAHGDCCLTLASLRVSRIGADDESEDEPPPFAIPMIAGMGVHRR